VIAANKLSADADVKVFDDIPALQRKWQAAVRPGQILPGYEEVMLGSLGRMADHIVLLQSRDAGYVVSRSGRYAQQWLGDSRWDIPLADVPPDCARALTEAANCALQTGRPHLATAHCVRDGLVQTYQILALPTASRWGVEFVGVYVNEHGPRYNLVDAIFSSTDEGIVSLAAIRNATNSAFDFQIVHHNEGAARLLKVAVPALQWRRLSEGGHALCLPDVTRWLLSMIAEKVAGSQSSGRLEIDSDDRNLRLTATTLGDLVSLTVSDVTEIKRRDASFRLLFDGNPMPMWVFQPETMRFLSINDAAIAHYGYTREQFLRMELKEIWPRDEWDAHTRSLAQHGDSYQSERNWRHIKADGTEIQVLTFGRRVVFDGCDGFLVAIVDITERRKAEARVAHMAHHDALTDLPNRTFYQERLAQALHASDAERHVAVLCVDLDLFKNVNDSFGHPTGDRLLKQVAERMRGEVHGNNLVARLGGDEFAIVLTSDVTLNEVNEFAARLIDVVRAPYDMGNDLKIVIGASVGVALSPGDGTTGEELLRNADMALYRAKAEGGNVHHFFEREMDRQAQKRRDMELDLRSAYTNGEFELHYQPLVDIVADCIVGFEALLRWKHPDKGTISPADFIPVAEDIGLIVALGEWVLRSACAEASKWPDHVKVAVNLSPVQFRSRNLVQVVVAALAYSGLSPHRLELEITESVFLAETENNIATLHQLRALGVRISMDDFGTGYSSLSYLRSFPFDKIKIDRSFVKDLVERPDCMAIVRAISGLGRSLNITTTAEGVETMDQLERLRAEGCNEVQGYLFSAARPAAELGALLHKFARRATEAA
jgi:diguanylate cyclase (GGDEF)-like protein/PAS domain S-box-containing protein